MSDNAKVRNFLVANAALVAVVPAMDITTPRAPGTIKTPSIVFKKGGGTVAKESNVRTVTFETRCYADTSELADASHILLTAAIEGDKSNWAAQSALLKAQGIRSAVAEQGPQSLTEADGDDNGIPVALGFFAFTFVGVEA